MCGIAGVYGGGDIRAMTRRLTHRGPDDEGYFEDSRVQLGARRLAVIDLSTGHQPLSTASGSHWITYNGELFNYLELREALEAEGFRFRTQSDTEVVVTAYEAWGPRCLERFIGMFAFAIWDGHELFLARDRLGEKPLFWSQAGDRFLFASEVKSLLVELPREPQLDVDFATLETVLEPATLFKGIHSLEPGHFLIYDGTGYRQTRYWALPETEPDLRPESDLAEELISLLSDAVRLRLRSDVPLGLFLSGGLDSSLLACLAKPEQVFSCRLPYGVAYDEWEHAQTVARAIGATQHVVTPSAEDFRRDFAKIIWHLEQPIATTSSLAEFSLARLARQHVKVALGGQGADEAFGGYVRYVFLTEEQRLAEAELLCAYRPLARLLWGTGVFAPPAERYFTLLKRNGSSEAIRCRVHEIFKRSGHIVDRMGATDFALTFPSLITMNDRAAAAYGIENRTPFLDHRVIEFAFRLPQRAKIDGFVTKAILRKAARGIVPDSIVDRPDKKGLGVPVGRWLSQELKPWAEELAHSLTRRGIDFAPACDRGQFDRSLFAKVSLELWFRTFIDGTGAAPLDE